MLIEQIKNGIILGSVYGLIAIGYTMVYGILKMINFAHSEIFMLGAFLSFIIFPVFGNSIALTVAATALVVGLISAGIEKAVYKPLRGKEKLSVLISAIGVSIFLLNLVYIFQSASVKYPPFDVKFITFSFAGITLTSLEVIMFTFNIVVTLLLTSVINKTRLGIAIRAVSEDIKTAELLGVSSDRIISFVFFIGGSIAAIGGVFYGMYYGAIKFQMGFFPGIKAFTAAVLGGIGNIYGALLGGLILGLLEVLAGGILFPNEWKDIFSFIILILVLLFKPRGLLGEKITDKV
ncbi:MAG: branched-chain amino acid ABC transporter permease [Elusimicrobiota bacterium]